MYFAIEFLFCMFSYFIILDLLVIVLPKPPEPVLQDYMWYTLYKK